MCRIGPAAGDRFAARGASGATPESATQQADEPEGDEDGPVEAPLDFEPVSSDEGRDLDDANADGLPIGYEELEPTDHDGGSELLDESSEDFSEPIAEPGGSGEQLDDLVGVDPFDLALELDERQTEEHVGNDPEEGPSDSLTLEQPGAGRLPDGDAGRLPDQAPPSSWPLSDGESGEEGPRLDLELAYLADDALPAQASTRFDARTHHMSDESSSVLAVEGDHVVLGASDLLWSVKGESPLRLSGAPTLMRDLVLVGDARETALFSTETGELFRRSRRARSSERLSAWRLALGLSPGDPATLDLWQGPASRPSWVLARASTGVLLESADAGTHWKRVTPLQETVLAMNHEGLPFCALVRRSGAQALGLGDDAGRFEYVSLAPHVPELDPASALVTCSRRTRAVGDPKHGLYVSADGGEFRRVPGCAGISAISMAAHGDLERLFAALHQPLRDATEIVCVNPIEATAEAVATIEGHRANGPELEERTLVRRLSWDPVGGRLFAAGAFGLLCWSVDLDRATPERPADAPE